MPPRLMMFALTPSQRMTRNDMSTPTGSVTMATRALRACRRKRTVTSATIRLSSTSFSRSVSMARWIRSLRS